jgi:hypothetical protein
MMLAGRGVRRCRSVSCGISSAPLRATRQEPRRATRTTSTGSLGRTWHGPCFGSAARDQPATEDESWHRAR